MPFKQPSPTFFTSKVNTNARCFTLFKKAAKHKSSQTFAASFANSFASDFYVTQHKARQTLFVLGCVSFRLSNLPPREVDVTHSYKTTSVHNSFRGAKKCAFGNRVAPQTPAERHLLIWNVLCNFVNTPLPRRRRLHFQAGTL